MLSPMPMFFISGEVRCGLLHISGKKSQPGKEDRRMRMKENQGGSKQWAGRGPGEGGQGWGHLRWICWVRGEWCTYWFLQFPPWIGGDAIFSELGGGRAEGGGEAAEAENSLSGKGNGDPAILLQSNHSLAEEKADLHNECRAGVREIKTLVYFCANPII